MGYKRILVPVDDSPTAARGMQEAIKLTKQARAKLLLLHVVEDYMAFIAPGPGGSISPILDALREGGARKLARIARIAERAGVRPQAVLVQGFGSRVADVIVDQAKRLRADLIVMGTHGRRGVKRVLLGSDADLVVRYSRVPVLLIPARGRGAGPRR